MVRFPSVQRLNIFCLISLYLVSLVFLLSVWFLLKPLQSISFEEKVQNLAVLPSDTTGSNAILFTAEDLKNALVKSDGVLAATRKNRGKTTGSAACVVDPGITECGNAGFAAFLLYTLDHILFCRALGINRPTVFWRACLSGCSKDPRVNSWDWYFGPVNRGLEPSEVENVFCPLTLDDSPSIIDNSFKNRSDVVGYEDSKIITTQERLRVNKLIHQYVKPNSGITKKVQMFYQQYLAGFNVLGVQVRGTDHWMETSEKKLPSLMSWVKKAQSILETLPRPRKIFIASDNNEVIRKFVIYFGKETVVFSDAVRAKRYHDKIPPHGFKFERNASDRHEREIGTQVLMDILLLAKCDQFLHTESSVASLASYFNPHMTSYFLQDETNDKAPRKFSERKRSLEETNKAQPMEGNFEGEDFSELFQCFQRNSAASVCPNIAKGIFLSFQEPNL